jgi:8-oxo-dGTP pyrophosphatase MutT (NUDIX family)
MSDVRANGVAVYVYRRRGAELDFLQIHRSATAGEYEQSWQSVYGGIEAGETAPQAALRELREEIGLAPMRMHQVEYMEQFYFRARDTVLIMPVFAAEIAPDVVITLNEEHDNQRWVPAGQVDGMFMWRTQREALHIILDELRTPTLASHLMQIAVGTIGGGE